MCYVGDGHFAAHLQNISNIMNYDDRREWFAGYDMLLRFYGCWKGQKYDALILHFVHAVQIIIV